MVNSTAQVNILESRVRQVTEAISKTVGKIGLSPLNFVVSETLMELELFKVYT